MIVFGWEITFRRVRPADTQVALETSLLCNDGSHVQPRMALYRPQQRGLNEVWMMYDGPGEVWKLCKHVRRSVIGIEVRLPLRAWGFDKGHPFIRRRSICSSLSATSGSGRGIT